MSYQRVYSPAGRVMEAFHASNDFIRAVIGPVGSSKSTGCGPIEILRRARKQAPSPVDGVRRTRWLLTAGSFSRLRTTTLETYKLWTGGGQLTVGDSPIRSVLKFDDVECEVWLLPTADTDSMARLLSMELTGVVHGEWTTLDEAFFRMSLARVGRFPDRANGGPTWFGVICEGHVPAPKTWQFDLVYGAKREGTSVFVQPPAVLTQADGSFVTNPLAENLHNLPKNYYANIVRNADPDFIRRFLCNEPVYVIEGQPVLRGIYSDTLHTLREVYEPSPDYPVTLACDPDLHGSLVFLQMLPGGRVIVFDELPAAEVGLTALGQAALRKMRARYSACTVGNCWTDPAGGYRGSDLETACSILNAATPWRWEPAPLPKNETAIRIETLRHVLKTLGNGGLPLLQVSPRAAGVRKALAVGYRFRETRSAGSVITSDQVVKDESATLAEAVTYGLIGLQFHDEVRGRRRTTAPRPGMTLFAIGSPSHPSGGWFED